MPPLLRLSGFAPVKELEGCAEFHDGSEPRESLSAPVAEKPRWLLPYRRSPYSPSRDIPFNKLRLSQANVRRVKAGVSIDELAEDIARRGLLQGLAVRPVLDAEGRETDLFEVPAGGRRYRALELLVKQKRLAKTVLIPCVVKDPNSDASAEEDSLAENVQRVALHPLDQFRTFKALRDKGVGDEEIAARFFVTPAVVKQRLRLVSVSGKLLDIYAEDGMTLEQLMAFSVTDDHTRQEQVWDSVSDTYNKEPYLIRRRLTESAVRASDRRARFVGLEAYEAAGGAVMRDLFQQDDGGWLEDTSLLNRLATEKLVVEADKITAESWQWVEVAIEFPYGHTHGLRKLNGVPADISAEEQATITALKTEHETLESEYGGGDELPDEIDTRLGVIETALAEFENRPVQYDPAEIVRAGVYVSIDANGGLAVDRGYVRPEDEAPLDMAVYSEPATGSDGAEAPTSSAPAVQRAVITIGGQAEPEEDEDDSVKPLPDRLVSELTAHRTLALRDAVANNPYVAMTALLHKFCLDTFQHGTWGACLEASVRQIQFPVQATDLKDSPSARGGRGTARGLESRPAEGRGRALGLARRTRRDQPGRAAGALRVVRRQRPL